MQPYKVTSWHRIFLTSPVLFLGEAIADFIAFSSPEAIILFGGLAKSGDYILKPIQKAIDDNILTIYKGKTKTYGI